MENNRINSIAKDLVIGGFVIECTKEQSEAEFEIPFSGMAFFHNNAPCPDFLWKISLNESDFGGKLIFGSDEYIPPIFLYQRPSGHYGWCLKDTNGAVELFFDVSEDWCEFTLCADNTGTKGARAFRELGTLFSYGVLNHGACVFHGVVMEYNGKGILVLAPRGTGKTTHTRMWRDNKNALIINGDRCLCRKHGDTWYAYGMPWFGTSGEYINRRVPVNCIVMLERGTENQVRRLSVFDGNIYLLQRIFAPVWQCKMQNTAISLCEEITSATPILMLNCKPDLESVDVLQKALEEI